MFRKAVSLCGVLLLAGAAVLMTPGLGLARGGHGGGGHGGGGHGGGGHYGGGGHFGGGGVRGGHDGGGRRWRFSWRPLRRLPRRISRRLPRRILPRRPRVWRLLRWPWLLSLLLRRPSLIPPYVSPLFRPRPRVPQFFTP